MRVYGLKLWQHYLIALPRLLVLIALGEAIKSNALNYTHKDGQWSLRLDGRARQWSRETVGQWESGIVSHWADKGSGMGKGMGLRT